MRKRGDPVPAIVWYAQKRAEDSDIPEIVSIILVLSVIAIVAYFGFSGKFKEWDNTSQCKSGCVCNSR